MNTKRALDLTLLAATAPIFVVVAGALVLLVWSVDGAPVFYVQPRVGRGRRMFPILKLRTMTMEADPTKRRPTKLGRWLRKRGLDEIPQLINVLFGDMSLVGPRPLVEGDAARLSAECPLFVRRFDVLPGITGLAQVCQARGAMLTAHLDAEYARKRSMVLDVAILVRTLWINLVGKERGARPIPTWNT